MECVEVTCGILGKVLCMHVYKCVSASVAIWNEVVSWRTNTLPLSCPA
jgi:hypothetical protein